MPKPHKKYAKTVQKRVEGSDNRAESAVGFNLFTYLPVTGDVLVLAGDIFYLRDGVVPMTKFWKWASNNYRQVLIVPGNHEYYNYCDVMERGLQWSWMFKKNVGYFCKRIWRHDKQQQNRCLDLRSFAYQY